MNLTILIAEDSATTRALIKRSILLSGLPVEKILEAPNGKDALIAARRERIDLIMADLNMPEMDGIALTRAVLSDPFTSHIAIIVVSADPNAERAKDLAEAGVRAYIRKPFTPEAIRDSIKQVIGDAHV